MALPGMAMERARRAGPAGVPGLAIVGFALAVTLAKALVPPWTPDALYYHLTLPRLYLEAGGFVKLPFEPIVSGYPGLTQMLFTVALAWGRDELAAVFSWMHLPLLLLASAWLTSIARGPGDRSGGSGGPFVAMLALASIPQLLHVSSVPLVEGSTALFVTVGLGSAVRAGQLGSVRWTVACSLALGMACSTKYLAAPACVAILVGVGAALARTRGARCAVPTLSAATLAIVLVFLPWGLKNQRDWGSPVFPFHRPAGTPAAVADLVRTHTRDFAANAQAAPLWWLPFDLTFNARPDDMQAYQGEVGPLLLALLPLPLFLGRSRNPATARALGGLALLLFLVWSGFSRQVRFLFPLVPPLVAWCLARPPDDDRPLPLVLVAVLGLILGVGWYVAFTRPVHDLPYLAGRESRASYYRTLAPTASLFLAFETLRREPADSRVIFFWEYRRYLCPRSFVPDYGYILLELPHDPDRALARLRQAGVTHLLFNRSLFLEERATGYRWPFETTFEAMVRRPGVVPIFAALGPGRQEIYLFRLARR
ncbi:MAG: hypothetical protein HY815_04530 [Candidatus Riflebacteria bacterium]|nr:hypothetical protein [Candidatus Riflebacteria bacterium]